jgi:RimK family alpha-L-glutamate ligase
VALLAPTDFAARIGGAGPPRILAGGADARAFDLFLTPRALGEAGDAELQLELYRTLAETGAPVVNEVGALMTAIDKFKSSWRFAEAGLPTPAVLVTQRLADAARFVRVLGRAVAKPVYGSLGIGVELVEREERLAQLLSRHRALYLQAFVERVELDVRAFVVGERVAAAVARRPSAGDFRSNEHQGGYQQELSIKKELAALAVRASRAVGLDYSGVDLVVGRGGPQLLEVNGTPSFRALNEATGRDMAEAIVDHAVGRVERARRRRPATLTDDGEQTRWR